MGKYTSIGGQALIEGIMMKSPEKTALAVRLPDGEIEVTYLEQKSLRDRFKFLNIPIIRGVISFVESMIQGYKAMMMSAEKSGFTDLEEETKEGEKKDNSALVNGVMIVGTVLGVCLAVVLFMLIPRLVVGGLQKLFQVEFGRLVRSLIEQFLKLSVFVLYVWLVSFMKDIKRVFMYHGAEHKTIFCYEQGLELTVENIRKQSRFHPRCGTSFMILMILVSVIISTLIQIIFHGVYDDAWLWTIAKLLMLPITCGVGFEVLKLCGRYDNVITRIISAPGLWLQRITTKEPEDDMIEIAVSAFKACEPEKSDTDKEAPENDDI